jgi:hypothetical protein
MPTLKKAEKDAREAFQAAANALNNARPHHVQERMSRAARNVLRDVGLREKPVLEEVADAMDIARNKLEDIALSIKKFIIDPETERQARRVAQHIVNEVASFVAECDKFIKSIDFSAMKKDIVKTFTDAFEELKKAANHFITWCKSQDIFPKISVPTPEERSARQAASIAKKDAPLKLGPKAKGPETDIPASHPLGSDRLNKLKNAASELEKNAQDFNKKPRSSNPKRS